VELSRTRNLRCTAVVGFEAVTVEVALNQDSVRITGDFPDVVLKGFGTLARPGAHTGPRQQKELFDDQLEDFVLAVRGRRHPRISGVEASRSIELIERCYAARDPLQLPWLQFPARRLEGES
jgi:predicted dehydrogenase